MWVITLIVHLGHSSSSAVDVRDFVVTETTKRLQATMKAEIESMFDAVRQATRKFIQALLEERKQYVPGKPLPEMPLFDNCTTEVPILPSGKASCSILQGTLTKTKDKGMTQCRLLWPNLDKEVPRGILYHSSSDPVMLHNRPLKSGQVKVEKVSLVQDQGGVTVPFPTDEVCTLSDAIGQFIAWPKHLVLPITENEMRKALTKESVTSPMDVDTVPSIIEDFRWMLDEFDDSSFRFVKNSPKSFRL